MTNVDSHDCVARVAYPYDHYCTIKRGTYYKPGSRSQLRWFELLHEHFHCLRFAFAVSCQQYVFRYVLRAVKRIPLRPDVLPSHSSKTCRIPRILPSKYRQRCGSILVWFCLAPHPATSTYFIIWCFAALWRFSVIRSDVLFSTKISSA